LKLKWHAIPESEAYAEKAILAIKKTRERKTTKRLSCCIQNGNFCRSVTYTNSHYTESE